MTEDTIKLDPMDHKTAAAIMRARGDINHAWAHLCDAAASLQEGSPAAAVVLEAVTALRGAGDKLAAIDASVGTL